MLKKGNIGVSAKRNKVNSDFFNPTHCSLCGHITNGYLKNGIVLCSRCNIKYRLVPDHIPVEQWERFRISLKKKRLEVKGGNDT